MLDGAPSCVRAQLIQQVQAGFSRPQEDFVLLERDPLAEVGDPQGQSGSSAIHAAIMPPGHCQNVPLSCQELSQREARRLPLPLVLVFVALIVSQCPNVLAQSSEYGQFSLRHRLAAQLRGCRVCAPARPVRLVAQSSHAAPQLMPWPKRSEELIVHSQSPPDCTVRPTGVKIPCQPRRHSINSRLRIG